MLAAWKIYVKENGVLEIPKLAERPGYSNAGKYYQDLKTDIASGSTDK